MSVQGPALRQGRPSRGLIERRQTLKNSPKPRLFFGLIPIPPKGFKAVFGHSGRLMGPRIPPSPRPTKAPGAPLQTVRAGLAGIDAGHKETPAGLAAKPGYFSMVFGAVFGNFSGQFLRKFQRVCAGKSLDSRWQKSPDSRRVARLRVAESRSRVAGG